MKKMNKIPMVLTSMVLWGLPAFAQSPFSSCTGGYIECAKQMAKADQEAVQHRIDTEVAGKTPYPTCLAEELALQLSYDAWFLEHSRDFTAIEEAVNQAVKDANIQLNKVRSEKIQPIAVKGQAEEKNISLDDLIEYFAQLNTSLQGKSEAEKQQIIEINQNPRMNKIRISHQQAVDTLNMLTTTMNASLRDLNADFEIGFSPDSKDFKLEVRIETRVLGSTQIFRADLPAGSDPLKVTDANLWQTMIQNGVKIDSKSIDGAIRYRTIQTDERTASCKTSWKKMPRMSELPFVLYSDLDKLPAVAARAREVKTVSGPSGTITAISVADGSSLHAVANGTVYRLNSSNVWESLGSTGIKGAMNDIAVGENGKVYGVDYGNEMFEYVGKTKSWKSITGISLRNIQASPDGGLYGLNSDNQLSCARQASGIQNLTKKSVGGFAGVIDQSPIVFTTDNEIFEVENRSLVNRIAKGDGLDSVLIQVVIDANEGIIGLTRRGSIYSLQQNSAGGVWEKIAGSKDAFHPFIELTIDADGRIYAIQANQNDGKIYVIQ